MGKGPGKFSANKTKDVKWTSLRKAKFESWLSEEKAGIKVFSYLKEEWYSDKSFAFHRMMPRLLLESVFVVDIEFDEISLQFAGHQNFTALSNQLCRKIQRSVLQLTEC